MERIVTTLTKTKETKGTHVYANDDMSIYIPKAKIKGSVPLTIIMTIEAGGQAAIQPDEPEM